MIVSEQKRFIFIHNPKCGGTVFRKQIEPHHDHPNVFWSIHPIDFFGIEMDFAHLRLWEVRALFPDVFKRLKRHRSIVFVRNPLRRFVSALNQHFRAYRPEAEIDEITPTAKLKLLRRFITQELTPERIIGDYRFVHFSPQHWFCMMGEQRLISFVIPMGDGTNPISSAGDALELDLAAHDWRDESTADEERLLRDPTLVAAADRLYARDRLLLGTLPHVRGIL